MAAMINTASPKQVRTGDFYENVMRALKEQGGEYQALRLDMLADALEPIAADGSHRWRVLEKVKAAITAEEMGLSDAPFEMISAREQEGYGFPQEVFPREKQGQNPNVRKRARKSRKEVEAATGQDEPKEVVNYWPIIAIKNPARASMKVDIADIAEHVFNYIRDKYNGRYDVVVGSKSFSVKFSGSLEESEEDESVEA